MSLRLAFHFCQILFKKQKKPFLFLIIMKLIDPFFKKGNPKSRQSTWIYYIHTTQNMGNILTLKLVCDDE